MLGSQESRWVVHRWSREVLGRVQPWTVNRISHPRVLLTREPELLGSSRYTGVVHNTMDYHRHDDPTRNHLCTHHHLSRGHSYLFRDFMDIRVSLLSCYGNDRIKLPAKTDMMPFTCESGTSYVVSIPWRSVFVFGSPGLCVEPYS